MLSNVLGWAFLGFVLGVVLMHLRQEWLDARRERINQYIDGQRDDY